MEPFSFIAKLRQAKGCISEKTKMGTGGSHLNPNYSGGRDQKDYGLKANSS
jgi:hypothetical protein